MIALDESLIVNPQAIEPHIRASIKCYESSRACDSDLTVDLARHEYMGSFFRFRDLKSGTAMGMNTRKNPRKTPQFLED